jgi:hypothetical protein
VELGKLQAQTTTTEVKGLSTTIEGNNGKGREVSWHMSEKDVIRAQTNIEVRVGDA